MSPAKPDADHNEPEIVDLTDSSVSSDDAAQVRGGGDVLGQAMPQLSLGDGGTNASVKLKTVVNGTAEIDGSRMASGNETFDVGGGSSV